MAEKKEIRVEITGADEDKNSDAKNNDTTKHSAGADNETGVDSVINADSDETVDNEKQTAEEAEPPLSTVELLELQVGEVTDKLLRVMADFDNYKKRTSRQYEDRISAANDRLLAEFIEIVDNFERAEEAGSEATDLDAFRDGMRMIYNQMKDLLERYDLKPIEALGHPFDPNLHEAMMQVETDEYDEGVVALEIGRGYKIGNRVLRHSRVGVASARKTDSDGQGDNENDETEVDR